MPSKVYLITGASSGIGAQLARNLTGNHVGMLIHARHSKNRLMTVAEDLRQSGTLIEMMLGDLATDRGLATGMVEAAVDRFGRLDAVIANAGFPMLKSFDDGTAEDISYAFGGNLFSFFELAKASHPHLKQVDNARLIAVGSFTAHLFRTDMPQFPMSAASKGGLETAVRSIAAAMAKDGITVNCVVPGYIEKDPNTSDGLAPEKLAELQSLIPLGRLGQPADVVAAIRFLLQPEADYITGQAIHVNGGLI